MDGQLELNPPVVQSGMRLLIRMRLEAIFGRDWKVASLFVLPTVIIMVGLIFWPLINAILISTTSLNFLTGKTVYVGLRNYAAPALQQRLHLGAAEHDPVHAVVAGHQVRHRHDHRADPQQPASRPAA